MTIKKWKNVSRDYLLPHFFNVFQCYFLGFLFALRPTVCPVPTAFKLLRYLKPSVPIPDYCCYSFPILVAEDEDEDALFILRA